MSPERGIADPSNFAAVGQRSDPAAMIAMLDRLKLLLRGPKDHLLERLPLEHARTALDVGCGAGGDVVEMARRMPPGGEAAGVDASEAMIAEARRRHSGHAPGVTFRLGDALGLPYPGDAFDVCRVETVLQHLPGASQAVREMARVTRPGGQIGALELDQGGMVLDHPDQQTTRTILSAYSDSFACGWMGRQLPRLFRQAGLTGVSVDPFVILGSAEILRALLDATVTRLCDEQVLTAEQASGWWAALSRQEEEGNFLGGATAFVVTGTRPG